MSNIKTYTNKPGYYGKGSVEVAPPAADNEGPTRRLAISAERHRQPSFDVLQYVAKTHGTRDAIGVRDIVNIIEENKEVKKVVDGKEVTETKTWKYFQLSDYKYISFVQLLDQVSEVARGLVDIGITTEDVFNIYAETRCVFHPFRRLFPPFSTSGLTHSLNEPNCTGLFTNAELLPTLIKVIPNDPHPPRCFSSITEARPDIKVFSINDLRTRGKALPMSTIESRRPTSSTISCIMYTEWVITHANLVASVGAVYTLLGHHLTSDDAYLAYPPPSPISSSTSSNCACFFAGMSTGFGRVKTLTDGEHIKAFRPSIMVGVPAVWETIRKGIVGKVQAGGSIRSKTFSDGAIADSADACDIAMSGGAAISRETQEFLSVALVMLLQGYGMTESCGMLRDHSPPECFRYDTYSIEIKAPRRARGWLLQLPSGRNGSKEERGEVCIRGPAFISGYYKRDDLNSDSSIFPGDGDGTLTLIDRIKNLVKLAGGEYIALEQLESTYKSCNLVANICVHASQDAKAPIAMVYPHEHNLRAALRNANDIDHSQGLTELCADPRVSAVVLKECNSVGKKNGFKQMETLTAVILTAEEWTPERGLLRRRRRSSGR
ncbi:long-chain-fatty-acid-CoA-ligase [Mycena amicta]|nr:long-chain-fatty-acid-CoA-ligase [Mycena amicta]